MFLCIAIFLLQFNSAKSLYLNSGHVQKSTFSRKYFVFTKNNGEVRSAFSFYAGLPGATSLPSMRPVHFLQLFPVIDQNEKVYCGGGVGGGEIKVDFDYF